MRIINPYRGQIGGSVLPFSNMVMSLSLRKYGSWNNAILRIRRSSDDAFAYVFFDGNTVSLNSLISISSNTTPSATTLSTWIGSDSGYVEKWYGQHSDGIISAFGSQIINSLQPTFINSGVIITKNSKPAIDFTSTEKRLTVSGSPFTELNSGNSFSIFSVFSVSVVGHVGAVYNTSTTVGDRLVTFGDSRTSTAHRHTIAQASTTAFADLNDFTPTLDQRLYTLIMNSRNITPYYNSVLQVSDSYTGDYENTTLTIGVQHANQNPLNGMIQEIAIYSEDKSTDRTIIETEINNYYDIY